jgi:hypothetical protein
MALGECHVFVVGELRVAKPTPKIEVTIDQPADGFATSSRPKPPTWRSPSSSASRTTPASLYFVTEPGMTELLPSSGPDLRSWSDSEYLSSGSSQRQ